MSSHEFLSALVRNPRQIGAILPSGTALASAMARQLVDTNATILELGPGTGVITEALLSYGIKSDNLYLLEKDAHMAQRLRNHYNELTILCGDATKSSALLKSIQVDSVSSVVSSLPLLNIPLMPRYRILKSIFEIVQPGGNVIQFTYSPFPPIHRRICDSLNVIGQRKDFIIKNIPPAFVWEYKRKETE